MTLPDDRDGANAATATLAVLAGGAGSRMGRPKAELRVAGQPILAYLLDRFRWPGPTLLVTAPGRERPQGAERFAREVSDPAPGEGPLRGVLTALEAADTEIAVVTTCDMPLLEQSHLARLADALIASPGRELAMWSHGSQLEPFPLAIRRRALPRVAERFADGERSMHALRALEGFLQVVAPAAWRADVWTNLNTPEDLAALEGG